MKIDTLEVIRYSVFLGNYCSNNIRRAHFQNEELSVAPIAVLLLIIHSSLTPMIITPCFQVYKQTNSQRNCLQSRGNPMSWLDGVPRGKHTEGMMPRH